MQAELNWSGECQMLATKRRREAGAQQSRSSVFDQHNSCFSKLNICSSPSLYLYSQAVTIPSVPAPDIRKPLQPAHRAADLRGVLLSCWKQSPLFLRRRIPAERSQYCIFNEEQQHFIVIMKNISYKDVSNVYSN